MAEEQPWDVDLRGAARGASTYGHPTAPPEEFEPQFRILAAKVVQNCVRLLDLGCRLPNLVRVIRFDHVIRTDVGQSVGLRGRGRCPDRTPSESIDELDASYSDATSCFRNEHEIVRSNIGAAEHMMGGHIRSRKRRRVGEIY